MKKVIIICSMGCLAITGITSCKKSSSSSPTTTTSSSTPSPTTPSTVDGGLVSLKTDLMTTAGGFTVAVTSESGVATFFTSTGNNSSFVDGGTVSVNSNALDKQSNNSYVKTATMGSTPADLGFSSTSNWSVGGAGSVPAFTYNDNSPFPTFSGTLPDAVTRSSGLTVSLSGLVGDADSVILFLAVNSTYVHKTVAGTASSVSFAASDLSGLSAVTNNSAVLEVVPYHITLHSQGSKQYAFIKEYAKVKNVNIN